MFAMSLFWCFQVGGRAVGTTRRGSVIDPYFCSWDITSTLHGAATPVKAFFPLRAPREQVFLLRGATFRNHYGEQHLFFSRNPANGLKTLHAFGRQENPYKYFLLPLIAAPETEPGEPPHGRRLCDRTRERPVKAAKKSGTGLRPMKRTAG